jgi:glycerol uptake facilitator-like aquaporin
MYLKRIFILIDDGIYFFLEFLGGFIAAGLVYGTYYDAINRFDNGTRQVKKHLFI